MARVVSSPTRQAQSTVMPAIRPASVVQPAAAPTEKKVGGQASIAAASNDRKSFVIFVKNACASKESPEFKELNRFLTQCFVDADTDFDGLIQMNDFDKLVERAGSLPRKWGFAPTTAEMFANDAAKNAFRKRTFDEIDTSGYGTFALDEWLTWSFDHIRVKASYLKYSSAESKISTSMEDFKSFIVAAAKSRHCPEYKELYHFLENCFVEADDDCSGYIDALEFDQMVEKAGAAPRKFGFAPATNTLYRNDQMRIQARTAMFQQIVKQNERSGLRDRISIEAWMSWAYTHICAKAKELDPSLTGVPPAIGDMSNASYGGAEARQKISAHRGISAELAASQKEWFVKFIISAADNRKSPEYTELFYFLKKCFLEADQDYDGLIKEADFETLVERAGALPRKWGYAPTTKEMFKTEEEKVAYRKRIFREINRAGNGHIYFDEWMNWSYNHICLKASTLRGVSTVSKLSSSPEDFKAWVIALAKSKKSPEYKELYHFLMDCYKKAQTDEGGLIDVTSFDKMIELAAQAPRRFGFAPPTNQTYRNDAERMEARSRMFSQIAAKNQRGFRDKIAFNSWLNWTYEHICMKAKTLDPTLTGFPPRE